MTQILANDGISKAGIKLLEDNQYKVVTDTVEQDKLADYINQNDVKVLLVRSATKVRKDLIDACPNLKIIGRGGVGMDNIDVEYARSKGLHVINTPTASSISVAELVFSHLFSMTRMLHESNRKMPLEGESHFKLLKKSFSKGKELRGKTLGIIGFGRIGQEVAKIGLGVGMNVIMCDNSQKEVDVNFSFFNGQSTNFHFTSKTMEELLQESDFITVNVPALGKPIIAKEEIALMKDGVGLVNASRGGVIAEEDLVDGLESGKIAFAGLDVFQNEPSPAVKLLMNENLSLTPHIGGSTVEAQERIGIELGEQIIRIFS